jgi:hypothetical protein
MKFIHYDDYDDLNNGDVCDDVENVICDNFTIFLIVLQFVIHYVMFYCIWFNAPYYCFSCYIGVFTMSYFTIHHVMFYCLSYYFILLLVML